MAYSQNDPAWKNNELGYGTEAGDTIGNYGCYVAAIANVCKWAGNDLTPAQVNDLGKQNHWFNADLIARDDIPALLCSNLQFVSRTNWTGAVDMNFFADASDPNVAYIIKIDASSAPGIQTHYTMVWDRSGATDLTIDDSWDGVRKLLSHYGNPAAILYSAMKFVKSQPAPAAAPATPAAKYEIVETYPSGKQVQLNKQPTNLWGMNYDFDYMAGHPVEVHDQGEVWTVVNKVHHQDGYDYYRRDGQVDGFNVADCDDYTPPAPESVTPVVPASPVTTTPVDTPAPADNDTSPVQAPGTIVAPSDPTPANSTSSGSPDTGTVQNVPPLAQPRIIAPRPSEFYTLWELIVGVFEKLFKW